jgi:Dna[CI] antecedent, DciA
MKFGFWLSAAGFWLLGSGFGCHADETAFLASGGNLLASSLARQQPTASSRGKTMIPLQSFSSGVIAEIVRRQPASKERTNFAWQLAVGPALARATTVDLTDGVLTVRAVDRRWMQEIDRAKGNVMLKMQNILGSDQVTRIVTRAAG